MNSYIIGSIVFGAIAALAGVAATILLIKGQQVESDSATKSITDHTSNTVDSASKGIRDHVSDQAKILQFPLRPIECAGRVYSNYSASHIAADIEILVSKVAKEVSVLNKLGFAVIQNGSLLEIRSYYNPEHKRDAKLLKKISSLDSLQKMVVHFFFPHIELHFLTKQVSPSQGLIANLTIGVKEYKTWIMIDTTSKIVTFEFKSLSMKEPELNDKTVTSLYQCLEGEVRMVLLPGYIFGNKPTYSADALCLKLGTQKEMYGYGSSDVMGRINVISNGAKYIASLYRILGRDMLKSNCVYYTAPFIKEDVL